MKELSIEEKAKRYDEAIKKLRSLHDNYDTVSTLIDVKEELENIFPELAESKDKKVCEKLIAFLKQCKAVYGDGFKQFGLDIDDALAWLEKQGDKDKLIKELGEYKVKYTQEVLQGEQKSNPCENCSIATNNCQNFPCIIRDCEQKPVDKVEPKFKVGDIITNGILIGEIDEIHEWGYHAYFGDHYADVPDVENWHKWTIQDAKANASYEGNADKKELKKIEQKHAWSEEDNMMLQYAIEHFERQKRNCIEGGGRKKAMQEFIDWLKSLKERVQPQPKQEWNEEDEKMYTATIFALAGFMGNEDKLDWLKNKLKSLRHQKQDVMSVDEFRHIVGYLVQDIVANEHMAETEKQPTKFFVEKYYKKLRPQSTWKPSDGQIKALTHLFDGHLVGAKLIPKDYDNLRLLFEQLKKLREEDV